jgi:hypothetical protein
LGGDWKIVLLLNVGNALAKAREHDATKMIRMLIANANDMAAAAS